MVPALVFALLSGDLNASPVTALGSHCRAVPGSVVQYLAYGIANLNTTTSTVVCPIPMDSSALGSTVTFRMRVTDLSTTAGFSCTPYVFSQDGNLAGVGAARTTGTSETGAITLAVQNNVNWTASVPGNVNTNMYSIRCTMPGNGSTIRTARAE
jgi:hypothetical protein